MTAWRIAFKYDYMKKYNLLKDKYATESEAKTAASQLVSSKPFKTAVVLWDEINRKVVDND